MVNRGRAYRSKGRRTRKRRRSAHEDPMDRQYPDRRRTGLCRCAARKGGLAAGRCHREPGGFRRSWGSSGARRGPGWALQKGRSLASRGQVSKGLTRSSGASSLPLCAEPSSTPPGASSVSRPLFLSRPTLCPPLRHPEVGAATWSARPPSRPRAPVAAARVAAPAPPLARLVMGCAVRKTALRHPEHPPQPLALAGQVAYSVLCGEPDGGGSLRLPPSPTQA